MLERRIITLAETKRPQSRLRRTSSLTLSIVLLASSCALVATFAMQPLLAQNLTITDKAPAGWFLAGSKPANYKAGVDHQVSYQNKPSAYLASRIQNTGGFGTLMQGFDAVYYAGKRVRFRVVAKTKNVTSWAGVWMRVDQGQQTLAFDNMQKRPLKGTTPFQTYDVVLNVPKGATTIAMGVLLDGPGEVWISNLRFEVVDQNVPETGTSDPSMIERTTPANLDFQK